MVLVQRHETMVALPQCRPRACRLICQNDEFDNFKADSFEKDAEVHVKRIRN
jgi:hypothetical protein